jgi:hypothetical protein
LGLAASCAVPAAAQQRAGDAQSQGCHVFAISGEQGQPSELRASCQGRGLMLGRATGFEAIVNEALQATLIDIRLGTERRVLLLTVQPDGTPLVEDLGGQLALAAGRGPMAELDGVELNLHAFAATGEIGVRGRPEDRGSRKADRVSLGPQIAAERSRRGSAAQN